MPIIHPQGLLPDYLSHASLKLVTENYESTMGQVLAVSK
jgi:hypothetical protein